MNIPNKIKRFTLYNKKPNTIDKGYYYQLELNLNIPNNWKKRMVRVYLPSDYDFKNKNKRFPVIYMTDGQNLVDHYLSGYGEWGVDEYIEKRVDNHLQSFIVVGIDCPHDEDDRVQEMMMSCPKKYLGHDIAKRDRCYGDILAKIILKEIKPLIDKTFYTLKDKNNTAVGGSSMGGLMSFYMGMKYKDIVGFSLVFSPGFLVYQDNYFISQLKSHDFDIDSFGKFFLYTGGKDFEKEFISLTLKTYDILLNKGFKDDQVRILFDSHEIHHESSWSKYLNHAIRFWLDE